MGKFFFSKCLFLLKNDFKTMLFLFFSILSEWGRWVLESMENSNFFLKASLSFLWACIDIFTNFSEFNRLSAQVPQVLSTKFCLHKVYILLTLNLYTIFPQFSKYASWSSFENILLSILIFSLLVCLFVANTFPLHIIFSFRVVWLMFSFRVMELRWQVVVEMEGKNIYIWHFLTLLKFVLNNFMHS